MSDVVIVAIMSLVGVISSAIISAIVSNSLIRYRLESLEKKVDSHNGYAAKFAQSSQDIALIKSEITHLREMLEKK